MQNEDLQLRPAIVAVTGPREDGQATELIELSGDARFASGEWDTDDVMEVVRAVLVRAERSVAAIVTDVAHVAVEWLGVDAEGEPWPGPWPVTEVVLTPGGTVVSVRQVAPVG